MSLAAMLAVQKKSNAAPLDRVVFLAIADEVGGPDDPRWGPARLAPIIKALRMPEADVRAAIARLVALGELAIDGGLSADPAKMQTYRILIAGPPPPVPSAPRHGHGPISPKMQLAVYRRDGFACKHCGAHADLTVDLILPYARGGKVEMDNAQTLCRPCNSSKGAR